MTNSGINPDALVSFQGAETVIKGEYAYRGGIDAKLVSKIANDLSEKFSREFGVFKDGVLYAQGSSVIIEKYVAFYKEFGGTYEYKENLSKFADETSGCFSKMVMMKDPNEDVSEIYEYLEKTYGDKIFANSGASFILEIISKDYSKYTASKFIAEKFGVDESKVLTVGDSTNDLPLLEYGFGVAVESGATELKQMAKYIAPSIEKMPVKILIDDILSGKKITSKN